MRTLALLPSYSCPPINPTSYQKKFFNNLYHQIDAFQLNASSEKNTQRECDEEQIVQCD